MEISAGMSVESTKEHERCGFAVTPVRKTILIVDDSTINRKLLRRILQTEYDTLEAENGQDALSVLNRNGDKISLILLDIVMPVMDGYEFIAQCRQTPVLSMIPVIVATNKECDNDEICALTAGACDYITKPYKPKIIMQRIANILNLTQTSTIMSVLEYDMLTGVYSKEFFYHRAREMLELNPETEYDIVCSDIENFKLVNDTYGIGVGDKLLRGIGDMSEEYINGRGICGRLAGDVFACLVERDEEQTNESMERYVQKLNSLTAAKNLVINFGVYQINDTSIPVSAMCDRAILAIDSIKGKFHRYVAYYDDDIRQELLLAQTITDSMETALVEKQFKVYLQPKFNIRNNKITGAEALVRWVHPDKGFLRPMEFIPIFEKNGFITKLDKYMWEETCRIIRGWIDSGITPVPVSVNVSRSDIYNLDLPETILGLVRKYRLDPSMLHLEITETAYTENPKQIIEAATKLREVGFIIEMDDFGTGYSSLNMLSDLPIDTLKLDMKLIQSEGNEMGGRNILSFIIGLAKWMNLLIIAEGVETEEQVNRLKYLNCNYAQGYFYSRPIPEDDFRKLLTETPIDDEVIGCIHAPSSLELNFCNDSEKEIMLIVHSSGENRCLLQETFSDQYCIAEVGNFDSALEFLKETHHRLAIIVLDMVMPAMDGFELLSILKHDESLCDIPIIITAQGGEGLELRAIDMGADDFVAKPYYPEVIAHHVRNLVDLRAYRKLLKTMDGEDKSDTIIKP